MIDFFSIFESHFFSNHHTQAERVESTLEARFPGYECVTFSSLAALVTSVSYEMCDNHNRLFNVSKRDRTRITIKSINKFLAATTRMEIGELTENTYKLLISALPSCLSPDVLLVEGLNNKAALLDFSHLHPMLNCAGVFVTSDAGLAEKVRWTRSSYGHRAPATINIAANGRLSEFQAALMNNSL